MTCAVAAGGTVKLFPAHSSYTCAARSDFVLSICKTGGLACAGHGPTSYTSCDVNTRKWTTPAKMRKLTATLQHKPPAFHTHPNSPGDPVAGITVSASRLVPVVSVCAIGTSVLKGTGPKCVCVSSFWRRWHRLICCFCRLGRRGTRGG